MWEIFGFVVLVFMLEFDMGYVKNILIFYLDEDFFFIRIEFDWILFYWEWIEEGVIDIVVVCLDELVFFFGEIIRIFLSLFLEEDFFGD